MHRSSHRLHAWNSSIYATSSNIWCSYAVNLWRITNACDDALHAFNSSLFHRVWPHIGQVRRNIRLNCVELAQCSNNTRRVAIFPHDLDHRIRKMSQRLLSASFLRCIEALSRCFPTVLQKNTMKTKTTSKHRPRSLFFSLIALGKSRAAMKTKLKLSHRLVEAFFFSTCVKRNCVSRSCPMLPHSQREKRVQMDSSFNVKFKQKFSSM